MITTSIYIDTASHPKAGYATFSIATDLLYWLIVSLDAYRMAEEG